MTNIDRDDHILTENDGQREKSIQLYAQYSVEDTVSCCQAFAESANMGWANRHVPFDFRRHRFFNEWRLQIGSALVLVQRNLVEIEICDMFRQSKSG